MIASLVIRNFIFPPLCSGLQTKYVVAADLHNEDVSEEPLQERPKPPEMTRASLHVYSDSDVASEHRLSATSGSLNLSQHNTEVIQV